MKYRENFRFFLRIYRDIKFAFCIADDREIYYLKTFALLIIIIFYTMRNIEKKKKKTNSRDIRDLLDKTPIKLENFIENVSCKPLR